MSKFRNFVFTHNNYANTDLEDNLVCRFISYSKEVAPTTLMPHLQGYVCFDNATTVCSVRKKLLGCHVEAMLGSISQNDTYISKMSNPIERGEKPMSNDNKGRASQLRWKRAFDLAKDGDIESIDADIQFRYYATCKRIKKDYMSKPEVLTSPCGIWLYGESGAGKSRAVFSQYPGHYIKSRNKWWCGYQNEDVVCCDDVGIEDAKWMSSFLKDWSDYKPFHAEDKGGAVTIRPKKFIVTSQYKIEDLWNDKATIDALNRRFQIVEKVKGQNIIL